MQAFILSWMAALAAFIVIDGIWLAFVARDFYQRHLGAFMRDEVWFGVAGLFYVLYTITVIVLVVIPAERSDSLAQAVMLGGLLGLCAYGTYDVTNLATLRGWPVTVAVVDMAWGTILTATISAVGYATLAWARTL